MLGLLLTIGIAFAINEAYKVNSGYETLWNASDALLFYGTYLAFLGAVVLGVVAVHQNKKAQEVTNEMFELEWRKHQPCFDILNNQIYNLYLGKEIQKFKNEITNDDRIYIDPVYVSEPRSGIEETIALIDVEVVNSGNSDIRKLFLDDMKFNLDTKTLLKPQRPLTGIKGNTMIMKGEKKHLIVEFKQEVSNSDPSTIEQETKWINETTSIILPHFELDLTMLSTDGIEYYESITLGTNWIRQMSDGGNKKIRIANISDLKITRRKSK